ncbi:MAG: MBL fold metallo-hydrolase [Oscillospiraceae bacterium]|nr:MBL fold metallo-hydrolase [Oscillospiraceae bacterium]
MAQRKRRQLPKKKKTKNVVLYCIVVTILFAVACISGRYAMQHPDSLKSALADTELQVHVIDVGQGDSILVIADGEAMLIDAAESGAADAIVTYLEKQGVTKLRYAVGTHGHSDHIGGFPKVLAAVPAERVIEPVYDDDLIPTTKTYERFLDAADACGASFSAMQAGDSFRLGGAVVEVLGPVPGKAKDLNNASLVLRVTYDKVSCLFTGDMEISEENTILESGAAVSADFLKVGHHGSDTSSGAEFLAAVRPKYAAVSCGVDNDYGHPCKEPMDLLEKMNVETHITAEEGDIVFAYDKETGSCGFVGAETAEK